MDERSKYRFLIYYACKITNWIPLYFSNIISYSDPVSSKIMLPTENFQITAIRPHFLNNFIELIWLLGMNLSRLRYHIFFFIESFYSSDPSLQPNQTCFFATPHIIANSIFRFPILTCIVCVVLTHSQICVEIQIPNSFWSWPPTLIQSRLFEV